MAKTIILSAITVVVLTGTLLLDLKHSHDSEFLHENVTFVDYDDEFVYKHSANPKILNVMNKNESGGKNINKRSVLARGVQQLSIEDKNVTQVDQFKRDKIKEVE